MTIKRLSEQLREIYDKIPVNEDWLSESDFACLDRVSGIMEEIENAVIGGPSPTVLENFRDQVLETLHRANSPLYQPAIEFLKDWNTKRMALLAVDRSGSAGLVLAERIRQIEEEGRTPESDDVYIFNELASAAACYASPEKERMYAPPISEGSPPIHWPWDPWHWKPAPHHGDRLRELTKAAALILAEMDRLRRLKALEDSDG